MEGLGTAQNPYRIDTADQLIQLGKASILWDKQLYLGADIDLDPNLPNVEVFAQAVIPSFMSVFDGNNRAILNLTITGENNLGLFGMLTSGAEVKDLGVVDVRITGSEAVGGLVGVNREGRITNCYSTGTVCGEGGSTGGLAGHNAGSIATSYSSGTVTGGGSVGGLVGTNAMEYRRTKSDGSVECCYSSATVRGNDPVGGLVGHNGGDITASYSNGNVAGDGHVGGLVGRNWRGGFGYFHGTITSSFWNIETSGQLGSAGGTGLTTAEMQTAATFLEAGWDFVGETANGTDDIWWILEGQDYPRLWWELENQDEIE
jgi:hypothetical protein